MRIYQCGLMTVVALSGAPSAALADGNCLLTLNVDRVFCKCDGANNEIDVAETAPGSGEFVVTGLHGTTINGMTSDSVFCMIQDLAISLGDGQDNVLVRDTIIPGDLWVEGGDGLNEFLLLHCEVGGMVHITNGDGGSEYDFEGSSIAGDLTIENGSGFDEFKLGSGSEVGGSIHIDNGDGDPGLEEASATQLEDQSEVVGDVIVENGSGLDCFSLEEATIGGSLHINNGPDEDGSVIDIESCHPEVFISTIGGDLVIVNGPGFDEFDLEAVVVTGNVNVDYGDGDSEIDVENSTIGGRLIVTYGVGSDRFEMSGSEIGIDVAITDEGGGGESSIMDSRIGVAIQPKALALPDHSA